MSRAEQDARIFASRAFLTEPLPYDWYDQEEEAISEFITSHAWERVDMLSADSIWDLIDDHAVAFLKQLKQEQGQ